MATKKQSYEQIAQELDGVVERMTQGGLTLDEMLSLYEKGMALSKECLERLDAYEAKIEKISMQSSARENSDDAT
ncbi:MAG: exodeoxyribonuclease VII small subunit [Bacillota bacterium]